MIRFMICTRMSRSCVAQAVESHFTVSTPSSIPTGAERSAVSAPAISAQEARISDRASGELHPNFKVSESTTALRPSGSRPPPKGIVEPGSFFARLRASAVRAEPSPKTRRKRKYTETGSDSFGASSISFMRLDQQFWSHGLAGGVRGRATACCEQLHDAVLSTIVPRLMCTVLPVSASGTSSKTAAVISTCSKSRTAAASRSRRD